MMWQNGGFSGLDQWNFVMHPVNAARTCDPRGDFVRRWVPGTQFNSISTECSTGFSTEYITLSSTKCSVENHVEQSVEIQLICPPELAGLPDKGLNSIEFQLDVQQDFQQSTGQ